jgi:hypothetical protein
MPTNQVNNNKKITGSSKKYILARKGTITKTENVWCSK